MKNRTTSHLSLVTASSAVPHGDSSMQELNQLLENFPKDSPRTEYSKLRNAREQATFNLMMRMDPEALAEIRQEFFRRNDSVSLIDFIYIMSKHLIDFTNEDRKISRSTQEERDFVMDMHELFKEVDVNGDGMMEWEEFTKFTVEKASLLNKRFVISTLPEYIDSTPLLDSAMRQFRRHNLFSMLQMQSVGSFAVLEEHRKQIPIYHASDGHEVTTIQLESVPLAFDWNPHSSMLITSTSDLQISTYQQLSNKKFQHVQSWSTPTAQKSLAWMESNETLYSGAINGSLHCWKLGDKISESGVVQGHSNILMKLLALDRLDNLMSASLDATIGCWDTYTNTVINKLRGHSKGIFELSFNPDYRLLFSCGFDHDVFVWSPFVNSLVYKLKGHRASLIGCQTVENSPEIITADEDGIFKLWDVRTFQCVQTFQKPHIINSFEDPNDHLTCFIHTPIPLPFHIPSRSLNSRQDRPSAATSTNIPLHEYRIYAGSRRIISFDQKKIVQEKTTDYTNVMWVAVNHDSLIILTVSNRNLIVWDLLLGSKMLVHNNICGEEISACCLDNRERKIILGDVNGKINVYNPLNGNYMKSCPNDITSVVMSLVYLADNRRFLAGYVNGTIRLYDESKLDDCFTLRTFDYFNSHRELLLMCYCSIDRSVITAGSIGQPIKLWDFDTGKCDVEIEVCSEGETVVSLSLLEPYPLVVTADSGGNIILWGSRGCKWKGDKITSFANINPLEAEMEPPSKGDHYNGIPPQRVLPTTYMSDERDDTSLGSSTHMSLSSSHHYTSTFENSNSHSIRGAGDEDIVSEFKACELKWGKVSAVTKMAWDQSNHVLYTGDELGHLRKWSLNHVIEELGGMSMMHGIKHVKTKITTRRNLKKGISGVLYTDTNASASMPLLLTKKTQIAFMTAEFCWALQGHNETIIECVTTKHGVLTSSTDNLVKMWTTDGLFIGILLHSIPVGIRSHSWDLPIDIASIREREERDLDQMMDQLNEMNRNIKKNSFNHPSFNTSSAPSTQRRNTLSRQSTGETRLGQSSLRKRIEMSGKLLGLDFSTSDTTRDETNPVVVIPNRKRSQLGKAVEVEDREGEKQDNTRLSLPPRPHTSQGTGQSSQFPNLNIKKEKTLRSPLFKKESRQTMESSPETLRIDISPPKTANRSSRQTFQNKISFEVEKKCSHLTSYEKLQFSLNKSESHAFLKPIIDIDPPEEKERKRSQSILEIRKRFNLAAPVLSNSPTDTPHHPHPPGSAFSRLDSDQYASSAFSLSDIGTPVETPHQSKSHKIMKQFSSTASLV